MSHPIASAPASDRDAAGLETTGRHGPCLVGAGLPREEIDAALDIVTRIPQLSPNITS
jgi:hypothetical protein